MKEKLGYGKYPQSIKINYCTGPAEARSGRLRMRSDPLHDVSTRAKPTRLHAIASPAHLLAREAANLGSHCGPTGGPAPPAL